MTTAQNQQSRDDFEAWAKTLPAMYRRYMRRIGDGYETPFLQAAWNGWQAASALPAGAEPVAKIHKGKLTWNIPWPEYSVDAALLTGSHDLFTAAQVHAMGRVPPGWQAVPVEPTTEMVEAAAEAHMPFGDMALAIQSAIAAAPQPPAAPATTGAQPPTTGAGSATAGAAPAYRLLQRDIDTIQADDEFLRDDAVTWQADPQGIFVGMAYMSNVLRPARRAIESGQEIK